MYVYLGMSNQKMEDAAETTTRGLSILYSKRHLDVRAGGDHIVTSLPDVAETYIKHACPLMMERRPFS